MQTTAAELRGRILDADAGLSRVGKSYLQHLTDWQEHSSMTTSLTHSLQVGYCIAEKCSHAPWRKVGRIHLWMTSTPAA